MVSFSVCHLCIDIVHVTYFRIIIIIIISIKLNFF